MTRLYTRWPSSRLRCRFKLVSGIFSKIDMAWIVHHLRCVTATAFLLVDSSRLGGWPSTPNDGATCSQVIKTTPRSNSVCRFASSPPLDLEFASKGDDHATRDALSDRVTFIYIVDGLQIEPIFPDLVALFGGGALNLGWSDSRKTVEKGETWLLAEISGRPTNIRRASIASLFIRGHTIWKILSEISTFTAIFFDKKWAKGDMHIR